MTDRTIITLFDTHGFAERQARDIGGRGFDTLETIHLDDDERRIIQRAVEQASRRKAIADAAKEIEKARDYLARHAPELLAFKPEGIDHG
jgi:hypothetical protein